MGKLCMLNSNKCIAYKESHGQTRFSRIMLPILLPQSLVYEDVTLAIELGVEPCVEASFAEASSVEASSVEASSVEVYAALGRESCVEACAELGGESCAEWGVESDGEWAVWLVVKSDFELAGRQSLLG